jgi:hypothetical protein
MDLSRSEEQFLDWRKVNLTENSLLFFKPLWQEFPRFLRFHRQMRRLQVGVL